MHLYSNVELRDEPSKVKQNVVLNIKSHFFVEYAGGLHIIAKGIKKPKLQLTTHTHTLTNSYRTKRALYNHGITNI